MRSSILRCAAAAGVLFAAGLVGIVRISRLPNASPKPEPHTGPTRGFAEYEALLIIKQVTGNWPIESDRITDVKYNCRQNGVWTCVANAKVCRS